MKCYACYALTNCPKECDLSKAGDEVHDEECMKCFDKKSKEDVDL